MPAGAIADSTALVEDWPTMKRERVKLDTNIVQWADTLAPSALAGDMTFYSVAGGRELTRPRWMLVTHFFNHQTHHRGQVHCLMTQAGVRPDDTDLTLMDQ